MPRDCPHCGLVNPDESRQCDCGFDFHGGPEALREVYEIGWVNMIGGAGMVLLAVGLAVLFVAELGGLCFPFTLLALIVSGLGIFVRGLEQFWSSRHH
jgi:hypothetical protein